MPRVIKYPPDSYTWGYELELGDVDRSLIIPKHLGEWEYSERDIVNILPPYQYVAADPLGVSPPVGGEINTVPTNTIVEQVDKIKEILEWLRSNHQQPTACSTSHGHIHVRVPGLMEDVQALKRLTKYILDNQKTIVERCYGFKDDPKMSELRGIRTYLKLDGGRLMPQWMGENIINRANSVQDFIRLQACGKDGVSACRPIRYAVNTYCMKHTNTIEFRCFRGTLSLYAIRDAMILAKRFLESALNGGPPLNQLLKEENYEFAPFQFNYEECTGWLNTKWKEGRGKKERIYVDITSGPGKVSHPSRRRPGK